MLRLASMFTILPLYGDCKPLLDLVKQLHTTFFFYENLMQFA